MTWHNLSEQDTLNLIIAVDQLALNSAGSSRQWNDLSQRFRDSLTADPDDEKFREAVRERRPLSEPDMVDHDAFVSRSDDGAYVMGWIWVDNAAAGIRDIEVAVYPMKRDAEGNSTLVDRNEDADHWDVQVKEYLDEGVVDILDELEDLPTPEAAELAAQAFEAKYPTAYRED